MTCSCGHLRSTMTESRVPGFGGDGSSGAKEPTDPLSKKAIESNYRTALAVATFDMSMFCTVTASC